jgi:hypothetical protein
MSLATARNIIPPVFGSDIGDDTLTSDILYEIAPLSNQTNVNVGGLSLSSSTFVSPPTTIQTITAGTYILSGVVEVVNIYTQSNINQQIGELTASIIDLDNPSTIYGSFVFSQPINATLCVFNTLSVTISALIQISSTTNLGFVIDNLSVTGTPAGFINGTTAGYSFFNVLKLN